MKALLLVVALASSVSAFANCNRNAYDGPACIKFERADGDLNINYQAVVNRLNSAERAQLRSIQITWIKFRDDSCKFEAESSTDETLVNYACKTRVTLARAKELRGIYEMRNSL